MAKRKKRVTTVKKKKLDDSDENAGGDETAPSAKKVAASSTSFSEDDGSQNASFSSIETAEMSKGALGFSSHFWCNYCEFSADTKQELVTHMRQHMIKCTFCKYSSLSRAEVTKHEKCEHDDEVEVDSSSSCADFNMDKDPCCACVFCDFMTYSTEYLEKHTTSKHRGLLPKSVAKMISKSASAKVRQADALFYLALANERTETNPLEKEFERNSESPSSSNVIVIEEEKQAKDVKPQIKDLLFPKAPVKEETQTTLVSSCVKPDPSEERAEKRSHEVSKTQSKLEGPSDWKVKVETMYCSCCPFSNVSIEKLKCHTFSQHVKSPAIARNNSCETAIDLPDVTFFCVRETCTHSTNTCSVYEEHLMSCCASHQTLPEDEIGRLRSTIKFMLDFHKKHSLKTASGFLAFVSSVTKMQVSENELIESVAVNVAQRKIDESPDTDTVTMSEKNLSCPQPAQTLPISENQHFSRSMSDIPHPPPNIFTHVENQQQQQHAHPSLSADNHNSYQRGNLQNQPVHHGSNFFRPSNEYEIPSDNGARFQSSAVESQKNTFHQSHTPLYNQPISGIAHENNFSPVSNQLPIASQSLTQSFYNPSSGNAQRSLPSTSLSQQPQFQEPGKERNFQTNFGVPPLNSNITHPGNMANASSENTGVPMPNSEPFITSDQGLVGQQKAPYTSTFAPAPQLLQPHQQTLTSTNNQPFQASLPSTVSNPPKMLDLLSDSYSILLDDNADLTAALDNPMTGDGSNQSGGSAVQEMPASCNLPDVPMQQPVSAFVPLAVSEHSEISYRPVPHIPQNPHQAPSSVQPAIQDVVSHQPPLSMNHQVQVTASFGNAMTTQTPSQDFMPLPNPTYPPSSSSFTQQYTNLPQVNPPNLQQPFTATSQDPSPAPFVSSAQMDVPSSQAAFMKTTEGQQGQPASLPVRQNPAAFNAPIPDAIPNNMATGEDISQGQNFNLMAPNPQSSMPSFLDNSNGNVQPAQNWQGNQATDIPNFLVPTSRTSASDTDPNQVDPGAFPNQEAQPGLPPYPSNGALPASNQMTPVKNQSMNFARNMVGNSPLSPSIYLNGQAPRHNRSNWTPTDMMPRGTALPQIRPQTNIPARYPNPSSARQNLFPPYPYRGRGRPRGPRFQSRLPNPEVRPQDDDVILTAVVRGAPPQQPQRRPMRGRGGVMRGQRPPMPQGPRMGGLAGPGRGMIRPTSNLATPSPSKKPFDVSKHFVDLACVVNTANDDGEDEIQITGVTPGNTAGAPKGKAPLKVVDAKKFSFCCVHCGRDQGSKQVMKQHMKVNHNDSLLGAFRNVETGQFLFFCPQLRCEFMTYDETRLTDHLFSCYNLDKSKQLPFDLQSALKNLRSLKIRKVNTNVNMGGSHTNPIDLDGQGLRDTFNNNLTDAFDDMVENTIGRHMTKPSSSSQPTPYPSNFPPQGRPPGHTRPQRGRPIGNNPRMPRASQYQPRQAGMRGQRFPGQQGNVRMPPSQQPYRMAGRRNFRPQGPAGNMMPGRGGPFPRMTRSLRGRPPNPRPFMTNPALGNEDQPILIDIDSESTETATIPQNSASSASSQSEFSTEPTAAPPDVSQNPTVSEFDGAAGTEKAPLIDQPISGPYVEVEEVPSQPVNSMAMQQDQTNEQGSASQVSSVPTQPTTSVDSQFVSASNSYSSTTMHNEGLASENNEEQVNAILLEKVFAKVPHMPKKLSQRLVLRFKEFAAKRGVVITPNSKVIDEFVERISYKGSNPLSKQQPHQQQHQAYDSSTAGPPHHTQQVTNAGPQYEPSQEPGTGNTSKWNANASHHQSQPQASQNPSDVSRGQNVSNTFHSNSYNQSADFENQGVPDSFQGHSDDAGSQITSNNPLSQNPPDLSDSGNGARSFENHNQMSFTQSQNEPDLKDGPADNHSDDDHDVVETKVILPPSDLTFSGGFADLAMSAIDNGKAIAKSALRRPSSSSSRSGSPLDAASHVNSSKPGEYLQNSFSCMSSNVVPPVPTSMSTEAENDRGASLALREQVSINEKLLKKEMLPISYPMTREGEMILVQSSVDHIVSGNESLEVDIAGKPLDSNNLFKDEMGPESFETADSDKLGKGLDGDEKGKLKQEKVRDPLIDKSSGRLILKVKKGDIPRRRNDSSISVVTKADEEKSTDTESKEETFIRRSERKRKVRPCEVDEDAMNELDRLISDDDEEYQVDSEDENYDDEDSDYEMGHSSKKKSKVPKDPNAFDVSQKGPYICWVCYKRFARCLGVKKHIRQKHSKGLCAIIEEEAGDSDGQIQALLFCPRNCKYVTSKIEAFLHHVTSCQEGEISVDGQNLVELQNAFISLEYIELQGHIASGAMTEMIKQKPPSSSGKKRQRSASLPETRKEVDQVTGTAAPEGNGGAHMMSSPSSH